MGYKRIIKDLEKNRGTHELICMLTSPNNVFEDNPQKIELISDSLVHMGDYSLPLILEMMKDGEIDSLEMYQVVPVLVRIGSPAVDLLISIINDHHSMDSVLETAAEVLGKIGDKNAVHPLINLLNDPNHYIDDSARASAASALGRIGDSNAVPILIQALSIDEEESIREQAALSLGNIGDKRAVEPLLNTLLDNNTELCSFAVYSLGKIGDKRAIKPLKQLQNHDDEMIRDEVNMALDKLSNQ